MNIKEKKRITKAVNSAVACLGSQSCLAKALNVHHSMIHHWLSGRAPISIKRAFQIQGATNGKVKAEELVEWLPPNQK